MKENDWRNLIKKHDKSGMLKLISGFHKQVGEALDISDDIELPSGYSDVRNIVVAGLGGSAFGGNLLFSCIADELGIPFQVVRDYELPASVNADTLFLAVSYSGNTEETLSAYRQAVSCSARIIGITSGGELGKLCRHDGNPVVIIPKGMPPRAALGYLFFPMFVITQRLKLVTDKTGAMTETLRLLEELSEIYTSLPDNPAIALAQKLYGRIPMIYGSDKNMSAVAYRWRTQINENSKTLAFHHVFPELNHNEIVGWEKLEQITQNFRVIMLRDESDHKRVKLRMDITKSIIGDTPAGIDEISSQGESLLARVFSLICFGDFLSFYLGILNGVDPTPVERIEDLKRRLARE